MKFVSLTKIHFKLNSQNHARFFSSCRHIFKINFRKNIKLNEQYRLYQDIAEVPKKKPLSLVFSCISLYQRKFVAAANHLSQVKFVRWIIGQKTGVILSASCLLNKYDFEANGITDATLECYRDDNEIDGISKLIDGTVRCSVCGKRKVIQNKVAGVEYCDCKDGNSVQWSKTYDGWQPFLEQENVLVWRKPHENHPNMYAYKVYGRHDDVSMCAFVETQLNTSYRTTWDSSVLELTVLKSDENLSVMENKKSDEKDFYSAQDLLYWLVKFPSFFANRDYVFKRRYRVDNDRKEVVIINECETDSSVYPPVKSNHRVQEYWSVMVIKATSHDFTKPGIEYILSYFDNPGTSLPSSITNFIASTAFPNFLSQVHSASLSLQSKHDVGEPAYFSLPQKIMERGLKIHQNYEHKVMLENNEVQRENFLTISEQIRETLEALGEISPIPPDKLHLIQEFDKLLSDTLNSLEENHHLVSKIKMTRRKLEEFTENAKKRKEESLRLMDKEISKRSNRYDENKLQTSIVVMDLFKAMKDVLQEDIDMRTGKGLIADDNADPPTSWGDWFYGVFVDKPLSVVRSPKKENKNDTDSTESETDSSTDDENEEDILEIHECGKIKKEPQYYNYDGITWPSVSNAQKNSFGNSEDILFNTDGSDFGYQRHNILYVNKEDKFGFVFIQEDDDYEQYTRGCDNKGNDCKSKKESNESWYVKPVTVPYRFVASFFSKS